MFVGPTPVIARQAVVIERPSIRGFLW